MLPAIFSKHWTSQEKYFTGAKDIKQNKRTIKKCFELIVTEEHQLYKDIVSPILAMPI
jgi:hypothetical protein